MRSKPRSWSCPLFVSCLVPLALLLAFAPARAQGPSTRAGDDSAKAARQPAQAPSPPFSFSGVLYANFQYGGAKGNRAQNRFDVERAYLNFRAGPGERDSIRVTLDIFQQRDTTRDSFYRGWLFRAKYAYLQHDFLRGDAGSFRVNARLGLVQTVVIDKVEQYWPRGLGTVAVDQNGYFASADAGIATTVAFPRRMGEVYVTAVNGPGYGSRETDRFKDYAARLTLAPLAQRSGFLSTLQISPWISLGERASDFAQQHGTVAAVHDGRTRDRYGVFAVARDPKLTLGIHAAWRKDVIETADTLVDVAPVAVTRTGSLVSAFAIVRPLAFGNGRASSPLWLVFRADHVKPDTDASGTQRLWIAGASWDLSPRTSVTLDVQNTHPMHGLIGPDTRNFFLHVIANF